MPDAEGARGIEHRQAVVDQQGARRVERFDFLQPVPEADILLGHAERVRTDDGVEMGAQAGARHLQRHALVVGVGDQRHAPARGAHGGEELGDARMHGDQVRDLFLEAHDVHFQFR